MIVVGIDPDLNGGIAVIDTLDMAVLRLTRMPVFEPPVSGSRRLDAPAAYDALKEARRLGAEFLVIEAALVKPQTTSKGPAMMGGVHTVHQTFGALRALSETLFTRSRVLEAWPSSWKKDMGLTSDKSLSLTRAIEVFPSHASLLSKQKNAGLAEAMLLVAWATKKVNLRAQSG